MIDPNHVSAHESGLIRIYAIDLPESEVEAFSTNHIGLFKGEEVEDYWALKDWLDADPLDERFVAILDVADLGETGLVDYLTEGYGVPAAELADHADALGRITGSIAVISSAAFSGVEQHLMDPPERPADVAHPLRHIVTLKLEGAVINFESLPSEGAKGPIGDLPGKKKPSDAAMSGRVATIALLVMALLVVLMIWVAG